MEKIDAVIISILPLNCGEIISIKHIVIKVIKEPLIFGLSEDTAPYNEYKNCIN